MTLYLDVTVHDSASMYIILQYIVHTFVNLTPIRTGADDVMRRYISAGVCDLEATLDREF